MRLLNKVYIERHLVKSLPSVTCNCFILVSTVFKIYFFSRLPIGQVTAIINLPEKNTMLSVMGLFFAVKFRTNVRICFKNFGHLKSFFCKIYERTIFQVFTKARD